MLHSIATMSPRDPGSAGTIPRTILVTLELPQNTSPVYRVITQVTLPGLLYIISKVHT